MHLIPVLSRKARQGWGTQFCAALTWIVQEHDVLVVPATGLSPLAIGIEGSWSGGGELFDPTLAAGAREG
jgi:hypothetical protein